MMLCCQPFEYVAKTVEPVDKHVQILQNRGANAADEEQVDLDVRTAVSQADDEKQLQAETAVAEEELQQDVETQGTKDADVKECPETQDCLAVVLKEPGTANLRTVVFHYQPLGMNLHRGPGPIKISRAFPRAKDLGVHENSELVSIAGANVEELEYNAVIELFKLKIAPLRRGLALVFDEPEHGARTTVVFPTRPLGLEFDHGVTPVKITGGASVASRAGVHKGLELISIAGFSVEKMDFNSTLEFLQKHIASLPEAEHFCQDYMSPIPLV